VGGLLGAEGDLGRHLARPDDEEEIGGMLWADYEHLHENPSLYRQLRLCPWFEIAMRRDFS